MSRPGGNQEVSIVNESGLYGLALGSRKPEAKTFKRRDIALRAAAEIFSIEGAD